MNDDAGTPSLELGLIGNCRISALVEPTGRIDWCCFPRLDGDPIFSALVDGTTAERGFFDIELIDRIDARQYYERNTAILCTELTDSAGNQLRITDCAPRFVQYERRFRPVTLVRRLEVTAGSPRVCIRLRPVCGYGEDGYRVTQGSNHLRFVGAEHVIRLTTDASITHVLEEHPFLLETEATLVLGPDEGLHEAPSELGLRFLSRTRNYWRSWARMLAIPFEWQSEVIRAAITLKLSTFDDTGAVLAATTTSIPEIAGSERNWDYRYCWLRDAYFVVHALNRLGATGTLENYLRYIVNVVTAASDGEPTLQPLYGIGGERELTEIQVPALAGYRGYAPVRRGNDAWRQVQHDVYGAVILAATQAFFDQRLTRLGDESLYRRLVPIGERAAALYNQPDAGLWEFRGHQAVHTYSAVMCWAACDRLARIAEHLALADEAEQWRERADAIHADITARAFNPRRNAFGATFGGDDRVEPENAFNVCTFWFINALVAIGRGDEARRLFDNLLAQTTRLGLLSEDLDPTTGELWGNFPQTYSMVGLINGALRLSRPWEEAI